MNRIKEISVEMSDDETVSFDIFSQLEGAYPLVITMGEDDKGKKTYSLSAGIPKKGQTWDEFFEETVIPDEDMEYFLNEVPTLEEIYKDVYSQKDFNMALDGLKRFDEENGYDIFADDGFLAEIEEMAALIPEEGSKDDEGEDEAPKKTKSTSKSKKAEEPGNEDEEEEKSAPRKNPASAPAKEKAAKVASYPPLSKMKKFLEDYIAEEYPEAELPDDLTIAEVRSWYDLAQAGEALPFPEDFDDEAPTETAADPEPDGESENEEESKEESPVDEDATDKDEELSKAKARLQALKAKMKKK